MTAIETRLGRLATIWPPSCPTCRDRPAVVGIGPGEDAPVFPEWCPACGRRQPPIVAVVGVDVDWI